MKDIKIQNKRKNPEKFQQEKEVVRESERKIPQKKGISYFSLSLFSLMTASAICYICLVASCIFYAVEENKYHFKMRDLPSQTVSIITEDNLNFRKTEKNISYINRDSDTVITLK